MTTDSELFDSLRLANRFLSDLCDPKKTPGVPKAVRTHAYLIGRHYPGDYWIDEAERHVAATRRKRGQKG